MPTAGCGDSCFKISCKSWCLCLDQIDPYLISTVNRKSGNIQPATGQTAARLSSEARQRLQEELAAFEDIELESCAGGSSDGDGRGLPS